jgi:DNA-binding response OmpR family regulator
LVVEENAVFRSANAERLRAAGFEVLEAANSAEAEPILKSTTVDALFVPVRRG